MNDPRFTYRRRVAVGVDLGQSQDPTSIAVLEKVFADVPDMAPVHQGPALAAAARKQPARYNLRLLEQAPLGESYPLQAHRLKRILARESIAKHDPPVFVDYTGVGRAVLDIFRTENVPRLRPVTITFQGSGPNGAGGTSVPKIELVSRLQALMHTGALFMPDQEAMPLAKTFRRELLDFRVSYTDVGNARFGAREGAHDDLILAVALAVYGLTQPGVVVEPLRV